jgi:hypothetical protein
MIDAPRQSGRSWATPDCAHRTGGFSSIMLARCISPVIIRPPAVSPNPQTMAITGQSSIRDLHATYTLAWDWRRTGQFCNNFSAGLSHFYWLDNVTGSGTQRTDLNRIMAVRLIHRLSPMTGRTILSATYSGIWLSTTNARSWCLAPGSPTGVGEAITTYKQPDGTVYGDFALAGVFYPHDNGYHWTRLGYPPGNITNDDVWPLRLLP